MIAFHAPEMGQLIDTSTASASASTAPRPGPNTPAAAPVPAFPSGAAEPTSRRGSGPVQAIAQKYTSSDRSM